MRRGLDIRGEKLFRTAHGQEELLGSRHKEPRHEEDARAGQ